MHSLETLGKKQKAPPPPIPALYPNQAQKPKAKAQDKLGQKDNDRFSTYPVRNRGNLAENNL